MNINDSYFYKNCKVRIWDRNWTFISKNIGSSKHELYYDAHCHYVDMIKNGYYLSNDYMFDIEYNG